MIGLSAAWLLVAATGGVPDAPAVQRPIRFAQRIVREQIIIRIPARRKAGPPPPRFGWQEKKGPECIPARAVAGAAMMGPNSVDLILRDKRRLRARLERSCPALDYYQGFYVRPSLDGMICADRDVIRSRFGGECEIDAFRELKPKLRD